MTLRRVEPHHGASSHHGLLVCTNLIAARTTIVRPLIRSQHCLWVKAHQGATKYQHALECRRWGSESSDPGTKQDYLDMEGRWVQLAHSYEFAERLSNFTERNSAGANPRGAYR